MSDIDFFKKIVKDTVEILKKGGTILYPTDTIWGIGCDATNKKAMDKIYDIKMRSKAKTPIILVSDEEMLLQYINHIPPTALDLVNSLRTPLSIIYPEAKNLPDNVVANDGSIGIRLVKHKFCKAVISMLGKPIVSTSANISNEPTPLYYNDINSVIFKQVDYVVDRKMEESIDVKPSTLVKFNKDDEFEIIR